ncbi:hypothetical protein N7501_003348 [Penicillium viridicatum]|nr:hypothetical protein N7501_003348 [Penicillium viridicatum]
MLYNVQSKREAASTFGVSEATLRNRLKGIKSRSETRTSGYKPTDFEEKTVIKRVLDTDKLC